MKKRPTRKPHVVVQLEKGLIEACDTIDYLNDALTTHGQRLLTADAIAARLRRLAVAIVVVLAATASACKTGGGDDDGNPNHPDADPLAPDGAPCPTCDADPAHPTPDADPGAGADARPHGDLGPGAACDLLQDQCILGYTCRLENVNPTTAICSAVPATPLPERQSCSASSQCGYAMDCAVFCFIWCDLADPGARCADGQACDVSQIDPNIGMCHQDQMMVAAQ